MANKPKSKTIKDSKGYIGSVNERYTQMHITVPAGDLEKWRKFKEQKYNGLNAMSLIVRTAMNEYIERENKRG